MYSINDIAQAVDQYDVMRVWHGKGIRPDEIDDPDLSVLWENLYTVEDYLDEIDDYLFSHRTDVEELFDPVEAGVV